MRHKCDAPRGLRHDAPGRVVWRSGELTSGARKEGKCPYLEKLERIGEANQWRSTPLKSARVTGMFNVQEVEAQTRGPDRGNPTSTRQELCRGAPRLSGRDANAQRPARGGSKEVIDAWRNRTKVKCRKARATGEPASGGSAQYLSVVAARNGNEIATKYVEAYPVRSVGFRESGSR
jgi:hypothetical protein